MDKVWKWWGIEIENLEDKLKYWWLSGSVRLLGLARGWWVKLRIRSKLKVRVGVNKTHKENAKG